MDDGIGTGWRVPAVSDSCSAQNAHMRHLNVTFTQDDKKMWTVRVDNAGVIYGH